MLVLTRRRDEAVVFTGGITVRVLDSDTGKVRLGIEAPREVHVVREELLGRVQAASKGEVEAKR